MKIALIVCVALVGLLHLAIGPFWATMVTIGGIAVTALVMFAGSAKVNDNCFPWNGPLE